MSDMPVFVPFVCFCSHVGLEQKATKETKWWKREENLPEAARLFGESLRIAQRLAESDPANAEWQRDLSMSYWQVANVLEQQGWNEAMSYWRKAHDTLTAMVDNDLFVSPQDMQFLDRLKSRVGHQ